MINNIDRNKDERWNIMNSIKMLIEQKLISKDLYELHFTISFKKNFCIENNLLKEEDFLNITKENIKLFANNNLNTNISKVNFYDEKIPTVHFVFEKACKQEIKKISYSEFTNLQNNIYSSIKTNIEIEKVMRI